MKIKLKDKVVLCSLRTAIYALDRASLVFNGAAEDLKNLKSRLTAKESTGEE